MSSERPIQQQEPFVDPQLLKGFQDILPEDMIAINYIIESVRKIFEKYGFLPIDTPALEYLVNLMGTGGENINKEIFRLKSPEDEDIGLRYDLTVPLARIVAQYPDKIRLPFRSYHVGPVWRADKPGAGRFRQFTQFDIDAVGSANVAVDAELIRIMCDVMEVFGVSDYVVKVNDRKLMDSMLLSCGITDVNVQKHVLRVIDKLEKVGIDEVRKELGEGRTDESGDKIPGVHLNGEIIDKIEKCFSIVADTRSRTIELVKEVFPDNEITRGAVAEIQCLVEALESLDVDEEHCTFTPNLTRGLDYYTGPVFETILTQAPHFGSVMGGGRYDDLVRKFLKKDIPASGTSIGIERFLFALKHIGAINLVPDTTQVLITVMPGMSITGYLQIAVELRKEGIKTEIFFGDPSEGLSKQLAYANERGIPIAIIAGEDELHSGTVSVKDLRVGKKKRADISGRNEYVAAARVGQQTVKKHELVATVRSMLVN